MEHIPVGNVTDIPETDTSIEEADHSERRPQFSDTDAVLVRHRLRHGVADTVRAFVERHRPDEPGVAWLAGGDDVVTVSVFLEANDDATADLVWFVETAGDRWESPEEELERRSPLFETGLRDFLADDDPPSRDATRQLLHVHNPARPATHHDCDVVFVSVPIEHRPGGWVVRALAAGYTRFAGTRLVSGFEQSAASVVAAERMWTETLWLERTGDGYVVRWYMEADDMDRVMSAYEGSEVWVARWSNHAVSTVFGAPVADLGHPADAMNTDGRELLAHATEPELR